MDAVKNNFMCSTYKKKGKEHCNAHYIRESQLAEILLDDLRRITNFARQNEAQFAKHITKQCRNLQGNYTNRAWAGGIEAQGYRTYSLIQTYLWDNVLGKIPNEVFRKLSDGYPLGQKENQSSIPKREERLEKLKDSVENVGAFLEKAKQYTKLDTLTAEILNLLIDVWK